MHPVRTFHPHFSADDPEIGYTYVHYSFSENMKNY